MRCTQKFSLLLPSLAEPPQLFVIPPGKVSLTPPPLSEPPQLFVRPPGKASVADYESWDIAVLLFTMARSPVADHKVAQPELDVGPCHDCISPKTTPKDKTEVTYGRTGGLKKGPARAFIRRQAIFPPLFFNLVRRWGRHLSACVLDGPRRHCLEALRLSLLQRPDKGMAEDEESRFRAAMIRAGNALLGRFHRNDTRWAKLEDAKLQKAQFEWALLDGAQLQGASLVGGRRSMKRTSGEWRRPQTL